MADVEAIERIDDESTPSHTQPKQNQAHAKRTESKVIKIQDQTVSTQKILIEFDENGDGVISKGEMLAGFRNALETEKMNYLLKRITLGLFVLACILIGVLTAVVVVVVNDSVYSSTNESNTLVTVHDNKEISCAATPDDRKRGQFNYFSIKSPKKKHNKNRRLQSGDSSQGGSGYCGSVDCDDYIDVMVENGYVLVAEQASTVSRDQVSNLTYV